MGGSFHVAPGKSFSINHIHVHDIQPYSSSSFNTTHRINNLSFGNDIDYANTKPLNGHTSTAKEGKVLITAFMSLIYC
jgi:endoplasmic reticulum-Golgi intermediate compartment protein 3